MGEEPIRVTDVDNGLAQELSERIYEFNVGATGNRRRPDRG